MALYPSPQDVLAKASGSTAAPAVELPSPSSVLKTAQQTTSPTPDVSFGAGLAKTIGGFIGGVAEKVKSFYTQETKNFQDLGAGKIQITPSDLLKGTQDTFSALGSGALSVVKGFNQGIARIGESAIETVAGPEITRKITEAPVVQAFTKSITGEPTVASYQDIYHASRDYALRNNADVHQASFFGGLAVVGALFADNPLFAPEGAGFKLSAQGIKDLAAATTDDAVKGVLKREVPNLSPTQLDTMTPLFRSATDETQVKALENSIVQASKAPVRGAQEPTGAPLPKPEELTKAVGQIAPTPAEVQAKVLQTAEIPAPKGAPQSAEDAAARYYEEIVAPRRTAGQAAVIGADDMKDYFGGDYNLQRHKIYSQASNDLLFKAVNESDNPTVIFTAGGTGSGKSELIARGIAPNFDGVIYDSTLLNYEGALRQINDLRAMGKNVVVYAVIRDPDTAYKFTKLREAAGGHPVTDAAFVRSHSTVPTVLTDLINKHEVQVKVLDVRGLTTPLDYKNLKFSTDPLAVLEDSRYSEDYVRARIKQQQATAGGANAPYEAGRLPTGGPARAGEAGGSAPAGSGGQLLRGGFSPNLLKAIADEKLPGPISDLLATKFPKLSEYTRELFAAKLAGMKRTPDIEATLRILSSTDGALSEAERLVAAGKKVSKQTAEKAGIDPMMAAALSRTEIDKSISLASRALQTQEETALAQQEYDLLWEHASQPVLDRLNEVEMTRSFLRDTMQDNPASDLYDTYYSRLGRDVGDPTFALEDVMHKAQAKAKQISQTGSWRIGGKQGKTLAKYEESARRLDTYIEELGFKDFEEAQTAVEQYRKLLDHEEALTLEIRDLRPRARAIRILQPMMEDVPVIARPEVAVIDALADKERVRYDYRDITGFTGQFRDLSRNFEAFFGKHFAGAKKAILDPFDASKGAYVDEIKGLGDSIDAGVVSKYGFKRGSKEDKAIMDWGERELAKNEPVPGINFDYTTEDGLVKAFGKEKADKIMEAEQWFRTQYDTLIDAANEVRAKIYPNNPSKLIPKRKDYFRHYQEIGGDFKQLIDLFETPAGIDPQLAGISEFTKPVAKFLSFAQERIGQASERSAIGGFLDYAPAFAYMKHIDPHIGKFRYLRRKIAESAPVPGLTEFVEEGGKKIQKRNKGVNNFLEYLDDFSNDLAGKTNPVDRWLQKVVPGGRKTFRVISWVNSRVKANTILGNLSSSVAQAFNLPQGIASAKLYTIPGIQRTIASLRAPNIPMEASSFIKERYASPLTERFKLDWVEHPVRGSAERAKEFGVWITQVLDENATKLMWNSHYEKGLAEGVADPVKYADDMTRSLVAGRGIGEVPIGQKGKIFQLVAPFQIEVGNAWWVMKNWVGKKEFGTLAAFFIASYLMNEAAQRVRGSRVIFDPVNALMQGTTDAIDEMQDDGTPGRAATIFLGRQVGEILSNIPLGQTFASAISDDWVKGIGFPGGKRELFGQGDPGRFGGGLLVLNSLKNPLYLLLPPLGGTQAKKTIEGIQALLDGEVKSADGKTNFAIDRSPLTVAQAVLFGKNATPEAQKFYDQRNDLFMRVYRQTEQSNELDIQAAGEWKKAKALIKAGNTKEAATMLAGLEKTNKPLADAIFNTAQNEVMGRDGLGRIIGMLNVNNGARAKYITDQVKNLPTVEEQVAFLKHLDDQKLITKAVFAQLKILLPGVIKTK